MITVQILTKNNESSVSKTLDSLKPLFAEIIVADLDSKDNTVSICKKHGAKVFSAKLHYDYSEIRNLIANSSKTKWQLMIHPWEVLGSTQQILDHLNSEENGRLMVLKDDVLTKELRLWIKGTAQFKNPVYESLEPGKGKLLDVMIASETNNGLGKTQEILTYWKDRNPLSSDPDYYLACTYLVHKKYDDFLRLADHYLFLKNTSHESATMIKYYISMVNCYIKRNPFKSVTNIMECIADYPTMAEFWCMLGDIYLHMKEFGRAKCFYENAIIMGSQRNPDDYMPMELSKYEEYPQKMLKSFAM
jgi:glycosyltransferase involved in cell wall biosynthesis